ncbi:uncharacterized protein LOC114516333 [Dendronephthya gigantea]|uniref:uncharacterized protein LOC114516333 n=1 Tax=Dendronephthya gigantea TaxID=151771 RepID=UPI00106ABA04|nr:uncharacterized protein LOC114516333 [Dendronephthya gigantea]
MSQAQKGCLVSVVLCWFLCVLSSDSVTLYSEECLYGFYCDGMYDPYLNSKCEGGTCICSGDFVQTNCLANVSQCVVQHGPTSQGHAASICTNVVSTKICSQDFKTYHCSGYTNQHYEVHVLGLYQATSCCSDVPETSRIEVVSEGHHGRKVVLVLASTRPVAWYLDMEDGVEIEKVVLVCKTASLATVVWSKGNVKEIQKVSNVSESQNNFYGKGSDTIRLLQYAGEKFGPITSFTGRFQVEQWRLHVGRPFGSDTSSVIASSRYASGETSTIPSSTRSTILPTDPKPTNTPLLLQPTITGEPLMYPTTTNSPLLYPTTTSTPLLYLGNSKYPLESSPPKLHTPTESDERVQASSATPQTWLSSNINTQPPVSDVVINYPQVLPTPLVFFHAFGTLEFHHISGLEYYANGTLKVRAPVATQPPNVTLEMSTQAMVPTTRFNAETFSTNTVLQTAPLSPGFTRIDTSSPTRQSSIQTVLKESSKTLEKHEVTSTVLQNTMVEPVIASSSLVPTATTSSVRNMAITSSVRNMAITSSVRNMAITSSVRNMASSSAALTTPSLPQSCVLNNPCHENATCTDTAQNVLCTCKKGFSGDGKLCKDVNECALDPCPTNNDCKNFPGSYSCTCRQAGECRETRLVGNKPNAGRVEVLHNGEWGAVCMIGWDSKDAQVACRDVGYPYLAGTSFDLLGFGKIWLSDVDCIGTETKLAQCSHLGWGNVNRKCTHQYDVAVECVPNTIRLAGSDKPDEGRVEIYFDGEWGTICDNGWDMDDASIACTEMGFPGAERALMGSDVQNGTGRVWLDNVQCTGFVESLLKECHHNGWGNVNCRNGQEAGVKCKPKVPCDFELNTCSWRNEKETDNFEWKRHRTSTPTLGTGPVYDNTKKTAYGVYLYVETTGRKPGDKALLVSPTMQSKFLECMRFHYYMTGADIGQLNVNIRDTGSGNITRLWNLAGSRKAKWIQASVPLNFDKPSEIIFEAVSGLDHKGDIAIDDIIIENAPCAVYPQDAKPDTDECLTKPCDVDAKCTNVIGSYHCKCNKGYSGDGFFCLDIDECSTNPCHMNATCTNTIGGFSCQCNPNTSGICDDAYRPCGLREIYTQLETKIIGGDAAEKGSWPWTAAIYFSLKPEHIWCSGVVIKNEWILTAAHCFDRDYSHYTVVLGEHDVLTEEPEEQRFKIDAIKIKPEYTVGKKRFDIALVHLKRPANYTANVLPICLLENELPAGTKCRIAGWGTRTTNVKDYPQFLRQAEVPIVDRTTCQALYSAVITISNDMVCAGYTTGTIDTCQGDSGGPLMCQQGNRWYLAGLTSFGFDCAANGYPGVYANIPEFYIWVEDQIFIHNL